MWRWRTKAQNGDYYLWKREWETVNIYWNRKHESWAVKIKTNSRDGVLETSTKLPFEGAVFIADSYMTPQKTFKKSYMKKPWEDLIPLVEKHKYFVINPLQFQTTKPLYPSFDMPVAETFQR